MALFCNFLTNLKISPKIYQTSKIPQNADNSPSARTLAIGIDVFDRIFIRITIARMALITTLDKVAVGTMNPGYYRYY